jgi:hypothetical protein
MDDYRLAQLENRLALVEGELEHARRQVDALQRSSRAGLAGRLASRLVLCGAVALGALSLGTAAAAPKPQVLTVKAPFSVVSANGTTIFRVGVDPQGGGIAKLYSASQKPVVALQTSKAGEGGEVAVGGDVSGQVARIGGNGAQLALRFYDGNETVAGMGAVADGGILQINNKKGQVMAKIGNNGNGGNVGIYGNDGKSKARLDVSVSGHGGLDILDESGNPAATLAAAGGGGYFALTNPAGIARVEGGVLPSDQGIVRVFGPGGFDYIRGRK